MKLEGVFVATVTPFDPSGQLALETLKNHLEFLAEAGVQGFVACATTGEGPTLNSKERASVLKVSGAIATSRGLKVIAGCGGNSTSAVLELLKEAKDLGCAAGLVVTPYYNKPTPPGLIAHYEFLADRSPLPLLLYNVPSRTNVSLSAELVATLFQHENIVGIKEASGQYEQWVAIAARVDLKKKALLAGDDDAFAFVQLAEGSGIISASANVAPRQFVSLFELTQAGRWGEAFQVQKKIWPLVRALFLETNPAPLKCALKLLGRGENQLRLPLVPVLGATEKAIREALKNLELL